MHGELETAGQGYGRQYGAVAGSRDESDQESAGRGIWGGRAAVGGVDAVDGGEVLSDWISIERGHSGLWIGPVFH